MRLLLSIAVPLLLAACSAHDNRSSAPQVDCCTVRIAITVPADTGDVFIAGNLPALGPWSPGLRRMDATGNERAVELTVPHDTRLEYKFTLGSWDREMVDAEGRTLPNFELSVTESSEARHRIEHFRPDLMTFIEDWRGSGVQGSLVYWTDVESRYLGPTRHIGIWLPPGYDAGRPDGYPVLYMHDGKVLFDPRFGGGGRGDIWDVDDAVVRLVDQELIPPIIVVGVWNSDERMAEYSPWHRAPDYAKFLIEELMPRVNAEFNTATGRDNTAVMGSSMGGLLSYYLVTFHPDIFGSCGCISSAFILSDAILARWSPQLVINEAGDATPYIVKDMEAGLTAPEGARYWFDYGTVGGDEGYDVPHRDVRKWLLRQGFEEGKDFVVRAYDGADHEEAAWRDRLNDPLVFLFGKE